MAGRRDRWPEPQRAKRASTSTEFSKPRSRNSGQVISRGAYWRTRRSSSVSVMFLDTTPSRPPPIRPQFDAAIPGAWPVAPPRLSHTFGSSWAWRL